MSDTAVKSTQISARRTTRRGGSILRRVLFVVLLLLVSSLAVAAFIQSRADGPYGPVAGGELRTGELQRGPVTDWAFAHGAELELQLLTPLGSRITGALVRDGVLYIPCDLGFFWGRMDGQQRWLLHLIYLLKTWHTDAEKDGRVVLRIEGKRYEQQLVRVTEQALLQQLRTDLEELAREWLAPQVLGPAPTEGPRDIWFFRVDPR